MCTALNQSVGKAANVSLLFVEYSGKGMGFASKPHHDGGFSMTKRTNRPRLRVEYVPIAQIKHNFNAARIHDDRQIATLTRSIDKLEFNVPVILDGSFGLLAGNARVEAARRLGMTEIPAICVSHLSDEEKRAFVLADNRLAELGCHSACNIDPLSRGIGVQN